MHWAFLLLWRFTQSLPLKNSPTARSCYQDTLLLGWYFAGDEQCLVSLKQDAWNWGSSDQRILFLTVWGSFRCFFANSKCVFMCLHWREDWVINAIKPRSVECCSGVCPSVDFSHPHIWSWSSTRVTIRFFVTTLTKALLHQLASLARWPALRRVQVVSNVFH